MLKRMMIFLLVCLTSMLVGWLWGWDFTRSPATGTWVLITLVIAIGTVENFPRRN